jgi:hypothetical protein
MRQNFKDIAQSWFALKVLSAQKKWIDLLLYQKRDAEAVSDLLTQLKNFVVY